MESLLATDGIFISGTSFTVVDLGAHPRAPPPGDSMSTDSRSVMSAGPNKKRPKSLGEGPSRRASGQEYDPDSSNEPLTEPEPEDEGVIDINQTDVFEELFGYRRKAGAPRCTDPNFLAIRQDRSGAVAREVQGATKPSKGKISKALVEEITVQDLLEQGYFQPGLQNVTLKCKKLTFTASLNNNGEIIYDGKLFRDPGDFAHYIKKQHLHGRPGGNGWRTVHVDGVRLDDWRMRMLSDPGPGPSTASRPSVPSRPTAAAAAASRPSAPVSAGKKRRGLSGGSDAQEVQASGVPAGADESTAPPGKSNWVQCSSCSQWREVPDAYWPMIEASDNQEWFCKAATWDVSQFEPYTPICGLL